MTMGTQVRVATGRPRNPRALCGLVLLTLPLVGGCLDKLLQVEAPSRVLEEEILKPANAAVLVKNFLGRDYGFDSFEKWLNPK